jgi:NADH-quinone oxidoreductase subunit F
VKIPALKPTPAYFGDSPGDFPRILTGTWKDPDAWTIESYLKSGGYEGLKKALTMKPDDIIADVKTSGLRGRGGAGFPTGMKWSFVPKESKKPKYVAVNADEGEPGTFKDREIIARDPNKIVEGAIIAAFAIGASDVYIYCRGEFFREAERFQYAIDAAYEKGFAGDNVMGSGWKCHVRMTRGAGAYICGEETAMLTSLEGSKGWPKLKPPFPAVQGLFGGPTIVNNVETCAALPWILVNGGAAYAKIGTEKSTGTRLYGISGRIAKPGLYELPMGFNVGQFIHEVAGGVPNNKKVKYVIPGGSSTPILLADEYMKAGLDHESLASFKSSLGTGAVIVLDETDCLVRTLSVFQNFYAHETCGQCSPCREGVPWVAKICRRIEKGNAEMEEIDQVLRIADQFMGKTICAFADGAGFPIVSYLTKAKGEFESHIRNKGCPYPAWG